MAENFAGLADLVSWFKKSKRPFPWRGSPGNSISPYAVWVSEVMLQQTRAEVVIPYFQSWMKQFPDITSLAQASEDEVIKAWEGLGYYARPRRLLRAAQYLMAHHSGNIPSSPDLLAKIPGFGPYTVGAVASFAFHQKAAAVDGNVMRFLSRYLLIRDDIGTPSVQEEFRRRTMELLPNREPWVVMEAMIELGAVICKRQPLCTICPVRTACRAFGEGIAAELPRKSPAKATIRLTRKAVVLKCGEKVLVGQVPLGQVMAGLFEFPIFEGEQVDVYHELGVCLNEKPCLLGSLDIIRYVFTHYQVTLQPTLWEVDKNIEWPGYKWVALGDLRQLPFSSGHRRLCEQILRYFDEMEKM